MTGTIVACLLAHLRLSLVALALATATSLPLGVWAARRAKAAPVVLGFVGVVQTIPGLALLAVMVPALAALAPVFLSVFGIRLPSIGALPAILALTLYGMLPILRNTVAALRGIDAPILEAADAVGMTARQKLWRVELPLAMPLVVAGLRTSAVWIVGTATLATPVGATSLGNLIFGGLQTRDLGSVLAGCVAAAALALALDATVATIERGLRERRAMLVRVGIAAIVFAVALAIGPALLGAGAAAPVRIGAKPFTEQYVLAEVLAASITRKAGLPVTVLPSLGSTVVFDALAAGDVDAYVDYSGTIWTTILREPTVPSDRRRMVDAIRERLESEHGVLVVGTLGFENAYCLALARAQATRLGTARVSDLAAHAPSLAIGADYEFFSRPEWRALETTYGLRFREQRTMDPSLLYEAVAGGAVDVVSAYSSDGRIAAYDLVVLEDERRAIPPYDALMLASARFAREHPEALAVIRELEGRIDAETMRRLNRAVDADGRAPADVAREFVDQAGGETRSSKAE